MRKGTPVAVQIDSEDWPLIRQFSWSISKKGYAHAYDKVGGSRKLVKMSRLLLGVLDQPQWQVDHKNRNRLDNRRANLRIATPAQNACNRTPQKTATGFHGIKFHPKTGKWEARITHAGKQHYLGVFDSPDEALTVRREAEKEFFGAFAPTISPGA